MNWAAPASVSGLIFFSPVLKIFSAEAVGTKLFDCLKLVAGQDFNLELTKIESR